MIKEYKVKSIIPNHGNRGSWKKILTDSAFNAARLYYQDHPEERKKAVIVRNHGKYIYSSLLSKVVPYLAENKPTTTIRKFILDGMNYLCGSFNPSMQFQVGRAITIEIKSRPTLVRVVRIKQVGRYLNIYLQTIDTEIEKL